MRNFLVSQTCKFFRKFLVFASTDTCDFQTGQQRRWSRATARRCLSAEARQLTHRPSCTCLVRSGLLLAPRLSLTQHVSSKPTSASDQASQLSLRAQGSLTSSQHIRTPNFSLLVQVAIPSVPGQFVMVVLADTLPEHQNLLELAWHGKDTRGDAEQGVSSFHSIDGC